MCTVSYNVHSASVVGDSRFIEDCSYMLLILIIFPGTDGPREGPQPTPTGAHEPVPAGVQLLAHSIGQTGQQHLRDQVLLP